MLLEECEKLCVGNAVLITLKYLKRNNNFCFCTRKGAIEFNEYKIRSLQLNYTWQNIKFIENKQSYIRSGVLCLVNNMHLLYKHQWNTRRAFAWKHDIFTRENNMLSSHVKRSPLLWLHNKSRLSQTKSEIVWYFIGVYIIKRTLHGRLEIRNFSSRVEKYFTRSLRSLEKYFLTLEEKFRISKRPCNILYLFRRYVGAVVA